MSWVHVDDAVGVMAWLIAQPVASLAPGAYNVTTPQPVTQREFAKTLARVLHRPAFMKLPAVVLRCALGAQSMLLLEGQRVVPARLTQMGYQFRFAELDSALRDLCDGKSAA